MQFIKVDIDGTGERWRLAVIREQGTMYYFPEEDFEDLVDNYDDCEKRPVPWLNAAGELVCNLCGRHVSAPYDIGDECEFCGGHFIED